MHYKAPRVLLAFSLLTASFSSKPTRAQDIEWVGDFPSNHHSSFYGISPLDHDQAENAELKETMKMLALVQLTSILIFSTIAVTYAILSKYSGR
jgi:hypothetical protein